MSTSLPSVVAELLGLPAGAPRAVARTSAVVLITTMLVMPDTFTAGVRLYVDRQVERMTNLVTNVIVPEISPATPRPAQRHSRDTDQVGGDRRAPKLRLE